MMSVVWAIVSAILIIALSIRNAELRRIVDDGNAEAFGLGFIEGTRKTCEIQEKMNKQNATIKVLPGKEKGELLCEMARLLFPNIKPEHIRQVFTDAYAHTVSIEFILPYEEVVEPYIPK